MVPRPSARAAVAVVAVVVAVGVTAPPAPVGAHTEVLRASPGPGEQVTAPVDAIELTFLDPVRPDVTIEVFDLRGDPVADIGPVEVSPDRRSAAASFPPLSEPGTYTVEYRFSAEDGDVQREAYQFTISPTEGDGLDAGAVVGATVATVALLTGVTLALRRRRSRTPEREYFGQN